MLICNLVEIVHNIFLQQLGKRDTSLYIATFDDYVQTFKQSILYQVLDFLFHFHYSQSNMLVLVENFQLWCRKINFMVQWISFFEYVIF
jgi:hypothetical protein